MTLKYLNRLENLIDISGSTDSFKELYKEFFGLEPSADLIQNFESNCIQKERYETEEEYDDEDWDNDDDDDF